MNCNCCEIIREVARKFKIDILQCSENGEAQIRYKNNIYLLQIKKHDYLYRAAVKILKSNEELTLEDLSNLSDFLIALEIELSLKELQFSKH